MRMPGLNAEASLYTSKGGYRAAPVAHPNIPQEIVTPSQDVVVKECYPWERERCYELFLYCQENGHPWCDDAYQGCIDQCTIIWFGS
jgi:hypothetical protein